MKPHNWQKMNPNPQDITVKCHGCGLEGVKYPGKPHVMIRRTSGRHATNLSSFSSYRAMFKDEFDCDQELVERLMEM